MEFLKAQLEQYVPLFILNLLDYNVETVLLVITFKKGKSLSLICGTLTWLEDHDQNVKNQLEKELNVLNETLRDDAKKFDSSTSAPEPAWFTVAKKTASESLSRNKIKEELKKLSLKEERINKLKERAKQKLEPQELKALDTEFGRQHKFNKVNDTEDELLIEDYEDNEMDESVEEPCEEMVTYILAFLKKFFTI